VRYLLGFILLVACASADAGSLLDLDKDRTQRVVVTRAGVEVDPVPVASSAMAYQLVGILGVIEGRELRDLRAVFPRNSTPRVREIAGREVCALHVHGRRSSKRITIGWVGGGGEDPVLLAWDDDPEEPRLAELDAERFADRAATWTVYAGGYESVEDPIASVFELTKPLLPGRFTMDEATLKDRFFHGRIAQVQATTRYLPDERVFCRLPRGYDPKRPWALLVWVDPSPSGEPPESLHSAADELGLILVGAARSGNQRHISDRFQLAFDALETASRRYHVDPERVYVTGMSGGGRVASRLGACFPDVFMGCVPIVGMDIYLRVPTGTGAYYLPEFTRPEGRLLAMFRKRRLAAITGPRDFNHVPVVSAVNLIRKEGVDARVYEYPDMAHTMPTPERFLEVMTWVDGPARERRRLEGEEAVKAFQACTDRYGDGAPADERHRSMLERVTQVGPWTPEAWRAIELLGAVSDEE
jgi:dienelactone hydrolase